MNKPLVGLALGGFLGVFDGLSALLSAPEVAPKIGEIVFFSMIKGLVTGVLIGLFSRKVQSLPLGMVFGLATGLFFAYLVARMPQPDGTHYYWEIMLPGALLGTIVGYATQKYRSGTATGPASRAAAILITALATGATATAAPPAAIDSKAAFARLKALAGPWEGNVTKPDGPKGAVRFELTAGGSVVKETQFPGSDHEMLTVYHLEGNDLVLTHYCATGNQPRMKLTSATENELRFEYAGTGVPRPAVDTHMHAARLRFLGPDRIESEWTLHAKGQEADVARFFLSRKK